MPRAHQPQEVYSRDERLEKWDKEEPFQEIDSVGRDIGWSSPSAPVVMHAYQDSHRIAASNQNVMVRLLEGLEDKRPSTVRERSEVRLERITAAIERLSNNAKANNLLTISSLEQVNGALEDLDREMKAHARTRRTLEKKKQEIQTLRRQLEYFETAAERFHVRFTELIRTVQAFQQPQRNGSDEWMAWSVEIATRITVIVVISYFAYCVTIKQTPELDPYRYIH